MAKILGIHIMVSLNNNSQLRQYSLSLNKRNTETRFELLSEDSSVVKSIKIKESLDNP